MKYKIKPMPALLKDRGDWYVYFNAELNAAGTKRNKLYEDAGKKGRHPFFFTEDLREWFRKELK